MSTTQRSIGCSPVVTHSASTQPAPPAEAMPKALKPVPTKIPFTSGASPRMKLPSGVNDSGPLIIRLIPAVASAGIRASADFHVLLEMLPIVIEELELEILGNVAGRPGDRVRLVAAEGEPADLFLEIGAPVGIAHGGEARQRRLRSAR